MELFKEWLSVRLFGADVYLCFDRYRDYSTKSTTRSARAAATRVHQLDLRTPLPARDAVLKNSANKAQVTQRHRLVVTGDDSVPTQVSRGCKLPRLDLASTHEDADIIITQQAIHLAKEDEGSLIRVVCDDTDAGLLLFKRKNKSSLTMESPIQVRSCIDIKETARQNTSIITNLASPSGLTGCDSVAATYGVGKTKAIAVARKGYKLEQLGQPMADMDNVVKEATTFMAACYDIKTPCSTMT